MKMFTLIILFFSALLLVTEGTFAQKLTLKQCVEAAIANNLQVRQSEYQSQSDNINYRQAKANQLPFIGGNISHGINQGRSIDPYTNSYLDQQINFANYSINSNIILWNGNSLQYNKKQNELNYQASQMDWQQAKDNITINVILSYLQILSSQEQLSIVKKQVEVTKSQVSRLEILNADGAIAPFLLYDVKGQLSGDELTVIAVKNALETAKISLAQLMNTNYNTTIEFENFANLTNPIIYDGTPDNIYQTATEQLALIKAAVLRNKSAEKRVLSAKAQLLPVLRFNGDFGTNYSSAANRQAFINSIDVATNNYVSISGNKLPVYSPQNNFESQKITYGDQWKNNVNSSLSIGLQIPILNGLQAKSRVYQAQVSEKRTLFETQTIKTALRQSIDQAYINMNSAFERFQTLSKQLKDFTQSFQAAETRFNAGVISSVEYLIVKNSMDRTNANFITAKYDYVLRSKVLDFYQGKQLW